MIWNLKITVFHFEKICFLKQEIMTSAIILANGLPLVTLGVYLPGACRADNCLACSSTMAKAMDPVIFMCISGTNLSSPVSFIFCTFSQNSRSSSMSFSPAKVICRHELPFLNPP